MFVDGGGGGGRAWGLGGNFGEIELDLLTILKHISHVPRTSVISFLFLSRVGLI